MIKFIIYTKKPDVFTLEITHVTSLLDTYNTKVVTITDLLEVASLIPQLKRDNSVILLFASSEEELEDLMYLQDRLDSIPTILVLPDDSIETLQKGMLLHPFYYLTKEDGLNMFSFPVNELCQVYENYNDQSLSQFS